MPSKSPSQARLMAASAHSASFAKSAGVPQSVAKEFNQADKGTGIIHPKKDDTPAEKKLEGSWQRHPVSGKFVSSKPKPPSDSGGSGGWKTPGDSGKKTWSW